MGKLVQVVGEQGARLVIVVGALVVLVEMVAVVVGVEVALEGLGGELGGVAGMAAAVGRIGGDGCGGGRRERGTMPHRQGGEEAAGRRREGVSWNEPEENLGRRGGGSRTSKGRLSRTLEKPELGLETVCPLADRDPAVVDPVPVAGDQ